jgi:lipopolysaccharide export LptBFGC system permease protein LptF
MPVHRQAATQACRESVVVITAAIMVVIMVVIVLIVLIVVAVVAVVVAAATTSKILETFSNGQSLVRRPENEPQDKAKDNYNIYQNIHNNPMRRQCQFTVKRPKKGRFNCCPRTTTLRRSSGGVGWFSCL